MTLTELFISIANAIRNKKKTTDTILAINFASEIESIETSISEDLSSELNTQNNLLTTQETTINDITLALQNKIASGGYSIAMGIEIIEVNSYGGPAKIKTIGMSIFPSGIFRNVNETVGFCSSLTELIFDNSAKVLNGTITRSCDNLTKITFEGKPDSIASNSFYSATTVTDIYVPWNEGEVANAPWGCANATIHYNHTGEV